MGYKVGAEIADSNLDIEAKMAWHLTGNHVPPIDEAFVPVAVQAIELANTNNWDELLELPNGLERSVAFIINGMHLEPFVTIIPTPKDEGDN
jgi:hypothetical protein